MSTSQRSNEKSNALNIQRIGHVFATIRPGNQATRQSMTYMGQNYANLSRHHRTFLNLKLKARDDLPIGPPSNMNGQREIGTSDLPRKEIYEGGWDLTYSHRYQAKGASKLGLYLGEESDHKEEIQGIDLLVRFPGKPTKTPRIALLRFHPQSGILMIESLQKQCQVQYMLDNEPVILEVGKVHCFWQTTNLFAVNGLKFVLTYPRLGQGELDVIRAERDGLLSLRGLSAPDPRFPIIPPHNPLKRLDDGTIVFSNIAGGSFGIIGIGINIKSGEPCAVKSVPIRNPSTRKECLVEADILFIYPGKHGLLQASHFVCDHGNSYHVGQAGDIQTAFSSCRGIDIFHFVLPLATDDFESIDINDVDFEDTILQMKGPLQGLKILHDAGYMHRDVTVSNMFIISKDRGVLGDYGKAVKAARHNSNKIGPHFTMAPEIDGTTFYDRSADVWACGFAFVEILLPDVSKWKTFNKHGPQTRAWTVEACGKLDVWGQESDMHEEVSVLIRKMLAFDPEDRPTIESVLKQWPVLHDVRGMNDGEVTNSPEEGPPAKILKTSEAMKIVRKHLSGRD